MFSISSACRLTNIFHIVHHLCSRQCRFTLPLPLFLEYEMIKPMPRPTMFPPKVRVVQEKIAAEKATFRDIRSFAC